MPQLGGKKPKDKPKTSETPVVSAYSEEGQRRIKENQKKNKIMVASALIILFVLMTVAILLFFSPWNNG